MNGDSNGQPEVISPELLAILRASKQAMDTAELEFKSIGNRVAQYYKLQGEGSIDLTTGIITRKPLGEGEPS